MGGFPQLGLPFLLVVVRDATFTLLALMNAGYAHEARRWRAWLIRALGGEPALVQILYGLGGERYTLERTLPWLSATPARNRCASAMRRPVSCSSIFMARFSMLYQSRKRRLVTDAADWMLQIELLKHLETIWE